MALNRSTLRNWIGQHGDRRQIVDVLDFSGFEVNYIYSTGDERIWGLLLKLTPDLAEVIGTHREVLLWGTLHSNAQARDVEQAVNALQRNSMRVAQDVLLLVTADPNGGAVLEEAVDHLPITVMTVTTANLRAFRPSGAGHFTDAIRAQLFARDLYDLRPPVTRTSDFFGRTTLLNQIERNVVQGDNHVALFGLRKIGKTSFILRLREALRNRRAGLIAQIDLQRANAINPTAEYLLWHLGESLWDGSRRVRRVSGLRLFGRYQTFSDLPNPQLAFELFDHDLRLVMERTQLPVILMLDEIERIFPTDKNSPWRYGFVRLWQLLRGFDQEQPGKLRFIISGTNPQCVERHAVFGQDNPIYSYFSTTYLGPLDLKESAELLRSYGRKMGLNWTSSVIERAYQDTGGHPALLRTYASMVHLNSHPRAKEHTPLIEDARDTAATFLVRQGPLLAQVVAILEDQYVDEFEILNTLALGKVHEFREMAKAFPEDTAHLIGYGLCVSPSKATRLKSQLLQTYLQRRAEAAQRVRSDTASTLVGTTIDGLYHVQSLLSARGGYADVYRATPVRPNDRAVVSPDPDVALKVLRYGQLSVLEREVEVLQRLEHPNLVRFIGSGRLEDGRVYLAMEWLEGDTLREYCETATRPSEQTLMSWAVALLDALVSMHPKEREFRKLRAEQSSETDIQDLLEARYGYVHRDIKPENIVIVKTRGPVLIDFNISVRVSSPVQTVSATPGYLPVELIGPAWSPRVDLYQLGATLLQVAAGGSIQDDNMADLIEVMRNSVGPKTQDFVKKLIDTGETGYHTAFTARRDAQRALDQLSS